MTQTVVSTRQRVLAIDPSPRGFGFAVLQDEPLETLDWGLSSCKRFGGSCSRMTAKTIRRTRPTAIVFENWRSAHPNRVMPLWRFLKQIADVLDTAGVPVYTYSRDQIRAVFEPIGAYTKQQIAEVLVNRFPELRTRLPRPRQIWDTEDDRMSIFDAASLALTHLSVECHEYAEAIEIGE